MKRIEDMGIEELISTIGLNIVPSDLSIIFGNSNEPLSKLYGELNQLRNVEAHKKATLTNMIIRDALKNFEKDVNKLALILLVMYNSQREIEGGENVTGLKKEQLNSRIKKMIDLIGNRNFTVIKMITEGEYIAKMQVINSSRLIQCIKNNISLEELNKGSKKQIDRLREIRETVGIENTLSPLYIEDIQSCCNDEVVAEAMLTKIAWNALKKYAESHPEIDIERMKREGIIPEKLEYNLYRSEQMIGCMEETIEESIRYIDFDKLLITVIGRFIILLENDEDDGLRSKTIEGEELKINGKSETVNLVRETIENILLLLPKKVRVKVDDQSFTRGDIEKYLKRFKKGRYISIAETEAVKARLLNGETTLEGEDEQVLKTIIFKEPELETLVRISENNVKFLLNIDVIDDEELVDVLYIRGGCSQELFSIIKQKGILRYEQMIELFEAGIINGEMVASIEDEESLKRLNNETRTKVRELYLATLDAENDKSDEAMQKFSRYATLYKRLNIDGKSEEEIAETSFKLISSFEEYLTGDILQGLYQFGIIPLESAADWGADLTEMLENNNIKPTDLKTLHAKKIISIDSIKKVLKSEELSYEEKLDLIYSTFDGESKEEKDTREELIEYLGVGESYRTEKNESRESKKSGLGSKAKGFITDPHARWKLISLLDEDYSKKFLPKGKEIIDGHRVFLLPNLGQIVIERIHEKRAGRRVNAYGSATYVMEIEEFFKNMDDIIIDGAINRTFLRELAEQENAKRIIHSKHWGEAIKRQFKITPENERYTEEDRAEIDQAIANVEKSRKKRE